MTTSVSNVNTRYKLPLHSGAQPELQVAFLGIL